LANINQGELNDILNYFIVLCIGWRPHGCYGFPLTNFLIFVLEISDTLSYYVVQYCLIEVISMSKIVFKSMAKAGTFYEVKKGLGTQIPVYEGNKVVDTPLLPIELSQVIEDPANARAFLWWVSTPSSSLNQDNRGVWDFSIALSPADVSLVKCQYDLYRKTFSMLVKFEALDIPLKNVPLDVFNSFLSMSTVEFLSWLKDNVKDLNKANKELLDKYIEVYVA
jgi:hypothetical protein